MINKAVVILALAAALPASAQQAPQVRAPAAVAAAPQPSGGKQYMASAEAIAALPQLKILRASYAPVQFRNPQGEEERLVQSLFAGYLKANPGMRLSTALIDLDGNRSASLAVRFTSPATCQAGNRCYTTVLRMVSGHWLISMTRSVATLEVETVESRDARQKGESMLMRVDGREIWQSEPGGLYRATSWGVGEPLVGTVQPTLPQGISLPGGVSSWTSDTTDTSMILQSRLCDEADCRIMVLAPGQPGVSTWQVVMDTVAVGGRTALGNAPSGGMRDVLVDSGLGYDTWRWNAKSGRYAKVETSYASALTAAP